MGEGIRKPIYLSKIHDRDLISYFKRYKGYSFSHVARELMRDGVKHRQMEKQERRENVLQMSHKVIHKKHPEFSATQIKKTELSNEEIEDKLDNF